MEVCGEELVTVNSPVSVAPRGSRLSYYLKVRFCNLLEILAEFFLLVCMGISISPSAKGEPELTSYILRGPLDSRLPGCLVASAIWV